MVLINSNLPMKGQQHFILSLSLKQKQTIKTIVFNFGINVTLYSKALMTQSDNSHSVLQELLL